MLSEDLITELGSLIRRLERKIRNSSDYTGLERDGDKLALDSIEDAIIGLVLLHIKLRGGQ